jgi:Zn-dependent protease with chaperone function
MKKILIILILALVSVSCYIVLSYTDKEAYAQAKVISIAKQMNITWDIAVKFQPIENSNESILGSKSEIEYLAQVFPAPEYYQATIVFNTNQLKDVSRKQIREVIQHELLHVQFTEMREYIYNELKPTQEQSDWLHYHEERMMVNLTKSI